jgi:hypothetical protein
MQPSPMNRIVYRVAQAACDAILKPTKDRQHISDVHLNLFRELGHDDLTDIREAFAG